MRTFLTDVSVRGRSLFAGMSVSQKATAVAGGLGLLVAAVLLYRWAAAPDYQQLFGDLESSDAAAIVEQLETDGVPYELTDGGTTVMVPSDRVYDERIKLSSAGLPSDGSGGYELLDEQDLSMSSFQERTSYKRAIEGELSSTIEAIDGVTTAVVHVAMPEETVFSDEQEATKASVLVDNQPGVTMSSSQVQAVVSMVSSSVEGLEPENVTVTDSQGGVLSAGGEAGAGAGGSQSEQVQEFERRQAQSAQAMLDRILGPGNSTVTVTAEMDFGSSETRERTFVFDPDAPPLAERTTRERYDGVDPEAGAGGTVGPDGELGPEAEGGTDGGNYVKTDTAVDNAVGERETYTVTAPGGVSNVNVSAALDTQSLMGRDPQDMSDLLEAALGIKPGQGDTIEVVDVPFDRSTEEAAAEELAAANEAEENAAMWTTIRTGGLALVVLAVLLIAWIRSRRRAKSRAEVTRYVVEQIRADTADRTALLGGGGALALAGGSEPDEPDVDAMARREIEALVDRQPDEVAQLLRGWLVDRRADA